MRDNRRTRLVLGVLLIAAIILITLDFKDGGASPPRRVGADIFGPVERVTHDVTDPVASLFDSITVGPSAQSTVATLQRENAELRAELSSAQLSKAAKKQLAQLLQFDAGGYRIVAASVIAAAATSPTRSRWTRAARTASGRTRPSSTARVSSARSPR